MKTEELKQWKSELLAERQKELNAVDVKYKRKLAALDVLLEDDKTPSVRTQPAVKLGNVLRKTLTKLSVTREAVGQFPDGFTTAKLFGYVKEKHPQLVEKPADLSNSVWMLKEADQIEVVKKGAGPDRPPEYRATAKFRLVNGNGA